MIELLGGKWRFVEAGYLALIPIQRKEREQSMATPLEYVAGLTIGAVESVGPSEIRVLLDIDAPQATALNTGYPVRFPRLNSYLLIPNELGAVIGVVAWLGVEKSAFPKRTGLKDFGLIDLPFPLRKVLLTPVGTLSVRAVGSYSVERGIGAFPSVGDAVVLPTQQQLIAIIESQDSGKRILLGQSVLSADAKVWVDPDRLFGRHLAVLGNTGSGKSCTVAALVRASLQAARNVSGKPPNARFIVLDPNGEYAEAFADLGARIIKAPPTSGAEQPLVAPAWMWNSHEWSAFAAAAPGVQRPLLLRALRELRGGGSQVNPSPDAEFRRTLRGYDIRIRDFLGGGVTAYQGFRNRQDCGQMLERIETDVLDAAAGLSEAPKNESIAFVEYVSKLRTQRFNKGYFTDFSETDIKKLSGSLTKLISTLPLAPTQGGGLEDAPIEFDVDELPDHIERIAADSVTGAQGAQFVSTLVMRIRALLQDTRLRPVINPTTTVSLSQWLQTVVGRPDGEGDSISVIDLSLVPSDVVHIIAAVVARIAFEANQRYRRLHGSPLPTTIILEEAHSFVRRTSDSEDQGVSSQKVCRETFERIAREGRKFGVGLVLSSQRPSELSQTALAQCNTFLLHRVVNDRDQELIARLVPDDLGELLKELPSLPSRQAVLLGWASTIPVLAEIVELPPEHRPKSDDPKYWDMWTHQIVGEGDWTDVADAWNQ